MYKVFKQPTVLPTIKQSADKIPHQFGKLKLKCLQLINPAADQLLHTLHAATAHHILLEGQKCNLILPPPFFYKCHCMTSRKTGPQTQFLSGCLLYIYSAINILFYAIIQSGILWSNSFITQSFLCLSREQGLKETRSNSVTKIRSNDNNQPGPKSWIFLNETCIEVGREWGESEKPLSSIIVDLLGSTTLQNKNFTMDPTFLLYNP